MKIIGDVHDDDEVTVIFTWSTFHGPCYECGAPAAYSAELYAHPDRPPSPDDWGHLCSVCAAAHAAQGARIIWLNAEEDDDA